MPKIIISKALPEKLTGVAKPLIEQMLQPYAQGAAWHLDEDAAGVLLGKLGVVKSFLPAMGFTMPIPVASDGLKKIMEWLVKAGLSVQLV